MKTPISPKVSSSNRARDSDRALVAKFEKARKTHLGYPYNLDFDACRSSAFSGYLINNLGDPYVGAHYGTEVCDQERHAVEWLMKQWGCEDPSQYWGSIGASGTEGNIWAAYLARELLGNPILIHSTEAHYSIPKAAKILRTDTSVCKADTNGAIDLNDLRRLVALHQGSPLLIMLTCGTTMKGAHDDISGVLSVLHDSGVKRDRRYVHVDGALNAMVLPFVEGAPISLRPTLQHDIDSISTSGHKMIGTAMPCGLLVTHRKYTEIVAESISYLRSDDTTLMGSRNGHAVLAIWNRFMDHGAVGFAKDSAYCIKTASQLASDLRDLGVSVLHNPFSLTVVFPKPSSRMIKTYQLAVDGDFAHAVIMPNIKRPLLDQFILDYKNELCSPCKLEVLQ